MGILRFLGLAQNQIAVLLDAKDISPELASPIINELNNHGGTLAVRKVYGDPKELKEWSDSEPSTIGFVLSSSEQNETLDQGLVSISCLNLIMDAMDLLHSNRYHGFALGVSDPVYAPLVQRLRESGKLVMGFCNNRTPTALTKHFSKLFDTSNLQLTGVRKFDVSSKQMRASVPQDKRRVERNEHNGSSSSQMALDNEDALREILIATGWKGATGSWINLEELVIRFKIVPPRFVHHLYDVETLKELIRKIPLMELREFNGVAKVRIRTCLMIKSYPGMETIREELEAKEKDTRKALEYLLAAIKECKSGDEWQDLGTIENSLMLLFPNFSAFQYGFESFVKLVMGVPELEIRQTDGTIELRLSRVQFLINAMNCGCRYDESWSDIAQVARSLRQIYPFFKIKDLGARSISKLAKKTPEMEMRNNNSTLYVRVREHWCYFPLAEKGINEFYGLKFVSWSSNIRQSKSEVVARLILNVMRRMDSSREWFLIQEIWKKLLELHPNFKLDYGVESVRSLEMIARLAPEIETSTRVRKTIIWRNLFLIEVRAANWPGKLEFRASKASDEDKMSSAPPRKMNSFCSASLIAKARNYVLGALTYSFFVGKWIELSRLEFYFHVKYAVSDCGVKTFTDLVEMCVLSQQSDAAEKSDLVDCT